MGRCFAAQLVGGRKEGMGRRGGARFPLIGEGRGCPRIYTDWHGLAAALLSFADQFSRRV